MCFLFYLFLFINNQSTLKFFSPHEIPDPFNISIVKLKFIDEMKLSNAGIDNMRKRYPLIILPDEGYEQKL